MSLRLKVYRVGAVNLDNLICVLRQLTVVAPGRVITVLTFRRFLGLFLVMITIV